MVREEGDQKILIKERVVFFVETSGAAVLSFLQLKEEDRRRKSLPNFFVFVIHE